MSWDGSEENNIAAQQALDVAIGWYADPIYLGHYPPFLGEMLGNRLPTYSEEEWAIIKGSSDFYGMNTYTTNLIKAGGGDEFQAKHTKTFTRPDGTQLGCQAHCAWLQDYPEGFRALLNYLYKRYKMPIFVTENGFAVSQENSLPLPGALEDTDRVNFYKGATDAIKKAVEEDGVDIRSYFAWSLLDNFEWADGYDTRFGVTYVNYQTQERFPKKSGWFVSQFFKEEMARARKPDDNTEGDAPASEAIVAAKAPTAGTTTSAKPNKANASPAAANGNAAAQGEAAFGKQAGGDIIVVAA